MGESSQTLASAQSAPTITTGATNTYQPVAMGLTAGGGIASAYAQYSAGRQNQRLARINARLANEQATQAEKAGEFAANRLAAAGRVEEGAIQASAAGAGVVAGTGGRAQVAASQRFATAEDRRMILLNARRQAFGYRSKAAIDLFQGKLAAAEGRNAAISTALNTGSRLWQQAGTDRIRFSDDGDDEASIQNTQSPTGGWAANKTYNLGGGATGAWS